MKRAICIMMILLFTVVSTAIIFASENNCTDHLFAETIREPTCTDNGYTLNVCTICGYEYSDEIIPALGHDEIYYISVPPGCDKAGIAEAVVCNTCGELIKDWTDIPATGHKWKNLSEVGENDLNKYSCKVCNEILEENSAEYINIEFARLTEGKKPDHSCRMPIENLIEIYRSLSEYEKMLIKDKDGFINAINTFSHYHKGDIDLSGIVDATDLSLMLRDYGKEQTYSDINDSGVVNNEDLSMLLSNYGIVRNSLD